MNFTQILLVATVVIDVVQIVLVIAGVWYLRRAANALRDLATAGHFR